MKERETNTNNLKDKNQAIGYNQALNDIGSNLILENIANTKVGSIDWKKVNRERLKQQKIYQIVKQFFDKFGVCKLSLCDEHEQMQCEKCKFETFLVEQIGNLIEEFYKYEDDRYGEQENIKM